MTQTTPTESSRADLNPGLAHFEDIRFESKDPVAGSGSSSTFLRFRLRIMQYNDESSAQTAFQALLSSANPDIGLTYAWDRVILSGHTLVWLNAPCLLAEENWKKLDHELRRQASPESRMFRCRCGGNCIAD